MMVSLAGLWALTSETWRSWTPFLRLCSSGLVLAVALGSMAPLWRSRRGPALVPSPTVVRIHGASQQQQQQQQ
eukprot:CAMPEP_0206631884 /NCGR_PEP_ID=MMETSP0325_2-20121206/68546_1 /ASSEMBLY_ACC=CAM_ASM_000347 /TAXON_ID=2866 /ORGANISM="Crypthecodinium cohnii, Strain Seligo" /LENGTH=72 /DNA_ID=CAMNT_0054157243 /DNA_START=208 /DNA_END=423 /DNA_ORIENTATION=+